MYFQTVKKYLKLQKKKGKIKLIFLNDKISK